MVGAADTEYSVEEEDEHDFRERHFDPSQGKFLKSTIINKKVKYSNVVRWMSLNIYRIVAICLLGEIVQSLNLHLEQQPL